METSYFLLCCPLTHNTCLSVFYSRILVFVCLFLLLQDVTFLSFTFKFHSSEELFSMFLCCPYYDLVYLTRVLSRENGELGFKWSYWDFHFPVGGSTAFVFCVLSRRAGWKVDTTKLSI